MSNPWENVFETQTHGVNFCPTCGSLITAPESGNSVQCWGCGATVDANAFGLRPVTTVISKHSEKELEESKIKAVRTSSLVNEECPKCKNPKMMYSTAQLRSADEGQTIFYECPKCGYKFTLNS